MWFAHDPVLGAFWIVSDPTAATVPPVPPTPPSVSGGGGSAWVSWQPRYQAPRRIFRVLTIVEKDWFGVPFASPHMRAVAACIVADMLYIAHAMPGSVSVRAWPTAPWHEYGHAAQATYYPGEEEAMLFLMGFMGNDDEQNS